MNANSDSQTKAGLLEILERRRFADVAGDLGEVLWLRIYARGYREGKPDLSEPQHVHRLLGFVEEIAAMLPARSGAFVHTWLEELRKVAEAAKAA